MLLLVLLCLLAAVVCQENLTNPICNHQPDAGECDTFHVQWYYDRWDHRCRRFYYSGCGGNVNRFSSLEACESSCQFVTEAPNAHCLLPIDRGDCESDIERWYFDAEIGRCLCSYWTGCGGNKNRFYSFNHCMKDCGELATGGPMVDQAYLDRDHQPEMPSGYDVDLWQSQSAPVPDYPLYHHPSYIQEEEEPVVVDMNEDYREYRGAAETRVNGPQDVQQQQQQQEYQRRLAEHNAIAQQMQLMHKLKESLSRLRYPYTYYTIVPDYMVAKGKSDYDPTTPQRVPDRQVGRQPQTTQNPNLGEEIDIPLNPTTPSTPSRSSVFHLNPPPTHAAYLELPTRPSPTSPPTRPPTQAPPTRPPPTHPPRTHAPPTRPPTMPAQPAYPATRPPTHVRPTHPPAVTRPPTPHPYHTRPTHPPPSHPTLVPYTVQQRLQGGEQRGWPAYQTRAPQVAELVPVDIASTQVQKSRPSSLDEIIRLDAAQSDDYLEDEDDFDRLGEEEKETASIKYEWLTTTSAPRAAYRAAPATRAPPPPPPTLASSGNQWQIVFAPDAATPVTLPQLDADDYDFEISPVVSLADLRL